MSNLEQKIRTAIIRQHKLQTKLNIFLEEKQKLLDKVHNVELSIKEINDQLGARMEQTEASRLFHEFCKQVQEEIESSDAVEKQEVKPAEEVETAPEQWPSEDGGVSKTTKIKPIKTKLKKTPFTAYETGKLANYHKEGMSIAEIAKVMERTVKSVEKEFKNCKEAGLIK